MRSIRWLTALFLVAGSLVLTDSGSALAASASNQQYVDPLGSSGQSTSSGSSPASTSSSAAPASSATNAGTSSSSTGVATLNSTKSSQVARTLPYTGFDAWVAVGLGAGLIGTGAALRRTRPAGQR